MFSIHYPGHARIALAMSIVALPYRAWGQDVPYEPTDIADPIVVTATRMPTRYNKLISDVTVVDQETIRDYSPAEPISDILANTPGVTVRSNGGLGTTTNVIPVLIRQQRWLYFVLAKYARENAHPQIWQLTVAMSHRKSHMPCVR